MRLIKQEATQCLSARRLVPRAQSPNHGLEPFIFYYRKGKVAANHKFGNLLVKLLLGWNWGTNEMAQKARLHTLGWEYLFEVTRDWGHLRIRNLVSNWDYFTWCTCTFFLMVPQAICLGAHLFMATLAHNLGLVTGFSKLSPDRVPGSAPFKHSGY